MKTIKAIMLAGALAMTATASAQFANTGNSNATSSNSTGYAAGTIKDTNPYDRVSVSFMSEKISPDKDDDTSLSGFSVDYIHGFSLSKTIPLFIETGVGLQAGFHSNDLDKKEFNIVASDYGAEEQTDKITLMSIAVPVNLAYKFNINPDLSLQPYLGLNVKFNIIGKKKSTFGFKNKEAEEEFEDYCKNPDEEDKQNVIFDKNMFDKKDTGDKNATWKRFQLGWHIGVGMNYKALYLGLSYGTDFTSLCKKTNTSTFKVGVGINF